MATKICTKCEKSYEASTDNFYKHSTTEDHLDPRCKSCHKAVCKQACSTPERRKQCIKSTAKWRLHNTEKYKRWRKEYESRPEVAARRRAYVAKKRTEWVYGESAEEIQQRLEKQNHNCALCGLPLIPGRRRTIDHDHKTGKVRGILHQKCNTILGFIESNPSIVEAARQFLEEHVNSPGPSRLSK